jgi:hypothetical protein
LIHHWHKRLPQVEFFFPWGVHLSFCSCIFFKMVCIVSFLIENLATFKPFLFSFLMHSHDALCK